MRAMAELRPALSCTILAVLPWITRAISIISDLGNNRIRKLDLSQSALTYPTPTTVGTSDATDNPQTAIVSNIGNASLTVPPPSSGNNPNVSLELRVGCSNDLSATI